MPLSLRATRSPPRRFDFFPLFCLSTSRRRREELYKNICRWIGVKNRCPLAACCCYTFARRAKRKRKKEGRLWPLFLSPENRKRGEERDKERKKGGNWWREREGGRDIGVCLLRMRPKNRALKAGRDSSKHWKRRFRFLAFLAWETER